MKLALGFCPRKALPSPRLTHLTLRACLAMPRKAKGGKRSLLDEDEPTETASSQGEGELGFTVNAAYAQRFEHNKKREELHRLQTKHPEVAAKLAGRQQGSDGEESSSSEDEDDGYIPEDTERRIFETLLRIKRKDPAIYDSSVAFFPEEEDGGDEEGGSAEARQHKGPKSLFLKDVLAQQALARGSDGDASSSDEDADEERRAASAIPAARKPKAYDPEQEQLRRSFLEAAEGAEEEADDDGFEGVLKKRSAAEEGSSSDDADPEVEKAWPAKKSKKSSKKSSKKGSEEPPLSNLLDAYFADQQAEKDAKSNDQFLRSFILNRGWVDQEEAGYVPTYNEIVGDEDQPGLIDDEEDENHIEQMERFEAAYNFRFEEPGNANIASHPRVIEGTVRKEDDRRKRQREAKKQRKEEEMSHHAAEIKQLKNLKKKEIEEKLALIHKVAGAKRSAQEEEEAAEAEQLAADAATKSMKKKNKTKKEPSFKLDPSLLENDFDPEAWDRQMAEAFNDDYYAEEDEETALAAGEMDDEGGDLFADDEDGDGEEEEEANPQGAGHRGKHDAEDEGLTKEQRAAGRAEVAELLEEYFKLDYEGEAGGHKTRFHYKQVPANTFGLSVEDLLMRDDKELNQIMGLKKLAPYRDDQTKQRPNYKALQALRTGEGSNGGDVQRQKQHYSKGGSKPGDRGQHTQHSKGHKRPHSETGDGAGGGSNWQNPNRSEEEEKANRLASYAKLSLNKPGKSSGGNQGSGQVEGAAAGEGKKHKKQRVEGQTAAAPAAVNASGAENGSGDGSKGLTKAQKKNLKRHLKHKQQKAAQNGGGAGQ